MVFSVRNIREDDLELIMYWRMDKDVTRYMNTDPELTLEQQKNWYSGIMASNTSRYWLIEVDSKPAGIISLFHIDTVSKTASWGYYIGEKGLRSLKLAVSLEMSLYDYVFNVLGLIELNNETFTLNKEVIKLHQACGSQIAYEIKGEIIKKNIAYDVTHMSITNLYWENIKASKKYEFIDFNIGSKEKLNKLFQQKSLNNALENGEIKIKFHHIGYAVVDLEASIKVMESLGYNQMGETVRDEKRNILLSFIKNKFTGEIIEFVASLNEKSPVYNLLMQRKGIGIPYHICYQVENIQKTIDYLKKMKFLVVEAPSPAVALENREVAFMFQKNIGIIELLQT